MPSQIQKDLEEELAALDKATGRKVRPTDLVEIDNEDNCGEFGQDITTFICEHRQEKIN